MKLWATEICFYRNTTPNFYTELNNILLSVFISIYILPNYFTSYNVQL